MTFSLFFFFLLFLLCYIAILIGNLLVMSSIASSQLMKQPMYFFLSHLFLTDLCYTSTVTPKLIADLLAAKKTVFYHGCMTQVLTMHFFGGIEVFILAGMVYDRYVAICKPLCCTLIMTRQKCVAMISASCAGEFLHSFNQFLLAIFLPYCGPNEIVHYFCGVYPLLKLACTDTTRIGLLSSPIRTSWAWTFVVLLISYSVMFYTVRSYSVENCHKALSTCSSHITVVVLFFAPLFFIYIGPATTFSSVQFSRSVVSDSLQPHELQHIRPATTLPEDKVFALFYTIISPMFNPLIYTLINMEMKNSIKKLWCHITVRKEMN